MLKSARYLRQYINQAAGWKTLVRFPAGAENFFFTPPRLDWLWGPPRLLSKGYQGFLNWEQSGRAVKLAIHLHLVLRLRMRGAIPPLLYTSPRRGV